MGRARGQLLLLPASGPRRPRGSVRGPYKWTPERIEEELRAFTGDRATWPTQDEFLAAQEGTLLSVVRDYGGSAHWADRLGLAMDARQRAMAPYGTSDIRREVEEVIAELGYLPGAQYLRSVSRSRLATVVQQSGGAEQSLRALGLPGPARGRGGKLIYIDVSDTDAGADT